MATSSMRDGHILPENARMIEHTVVQVKNATVSDLFPQR